MSFAVFCQTLTELLGNLRTCLGRWWWRRKGDGFDLLEGDGPSALFMGGGLENVLGLDNEFGFRRFLRWWCAVWNAADDVWGGGVFVLRADKCLAGDEGQEKKRDWFHGELGFALAIQ